MLQAVKAVFSRVFTIYTEKKLKLQSISLTSGGFYYAHEIEEVKELYEEFSEGIEMDKELSWQDERQHKWFIKAYIVGDMAKENLHIFAKNTRRFGFGASINQGKIMALSHKTTKYKKVAGQSNNYDYIDFDPAEVLK